jgi:hypothetical protein
MFFSAMSFFKQFWNAINVMMSVAQRFLEVLYFLLIVSLILLWMRSILFATLYRFLYSDIIPQLSEMDWNHAPIDVCPSEDLILWSANSNCWLNPAGCILQPFKWIGFDFFLCFMGERFSEFELPQGNRRDARPVKTGAPWHWTRRSAWRQNSQGVPRVNASGCLGRRIFQYIGPFFWNKIGPYWIIYII